jgi:hypothetical protein
MIEARVAHTDDTQTREIASLNRQITTVVGELTGEELCEVFKIVCVPRAVFDPVGLRHVPILGKEDMKRAVTHCIKSLSSGQRPFEVESLDLTAIRNWTLRLRTAKR